MTIAGDLDRARHLTLAADEEAARDVLVSQLPLIEQADRDDYALEVFAQLGEIYLVRTAYEGVVESISASAIVWRSTSRSVRGNAPTSLPRPPCPMPRSIT